MLERGIIDCCERCSGLWGWRCNGGGGVKGPDRYHNEQNIQVASPMHNQHPASRVYVLAFNMEDHMADGGFPVHTRRERGS